MTRRQADDTDCAQLREVEAEFVLGTLDGHQRAEVVEHLSTCARCREQISSLSGAVSDLALLAPRVPPSPGFTNRVLAAIDVAAAAVPGAAPIEAGRGRTRQRAWRRPAALLAAVAAVVVLVVVGLVVVDRDASSRGVLAVAAMVDSDGHTIGTSMLANGVHGTVHVSVVYPSNWLDYRLEVIDAHGAAVVLGTMHLRSGAWQWSGRLPAGELQELRIVRPDGQITCEGALPV